MPDRNRSASEHDPVAWMRRNLPLKESDATETLYSRNESQSGKSLPWVYQPFDPAKKGHFVDQARNLDFAAVAGPGRVLDFGPGDGWPSLPIARWVEQVVGVEGCETRATTCGENAARLGVANARFVTVHPGEALPFDDATFDGATAASSIEQSPDPRATLRELRRVLKPGGRLRIHWESLERYRNGRERDLWPAAMADGCCLVVFDRDIDAGTVRHCAMQLSLPRKAAMEAFDRRGLRPGYDALTPDVLEEFAEHLVRATTWRTEHPSAPVLAEWLREAGFREARATHGGGAFAGRLFDRLDESRRPTDMQGVDALLDPLVRTVVEMDAPAEGRTGAAPPRMTAVK